MFNSELEMSELFNEFLSKVQNRAILKECKHLFGIPDFIFIQESENNNSYLIISFELKLKNWQRAIEQAFRYRNFSNLSYVILDESNIKPALKKIELFSLYNIGLATFNKDKELKVFFQPKINSPFCLATTKKLYNKIQKPKEFEKFVTDIIPDFAPNFLLSSVG